MMDKKTIDTLKTIQKSGYAFVGKDKHWLAKVMLDNIGHKESAIRDDLIYPTLAHLFYEDHFKEEALENYLDTLLGSDYLFYDMENQSENSVLRRSFSALQIVVLLDLHRNKHVIADSKIHQAFERFLDYFEKEKVFKGYDEKIGWMHAIAHSADVFDQFLRIKTFKAEHLERMFEAVRVKMKQETHLFKYNEDRRMAVALMSGIKRNILSETFLKSWVDEVATINTKLSLPKRMCVQNNARNLLSALYFALVKKESHPSLRDHIESHLTQ